MKAQQAPEGWHGEERISSAQHRAQVLIGDIIRLFSAYDKNLHIGFPLADRESNFISNPTLQLPQFTIK